MNSSRTPRPTARILDGRHELVVDGLSRKQDSFTLRYTVTPPLPEGDDASLVLLALEARDDAGNEYSDWGGAYGLSEDGAHTDGTITGQPAVAPSARVLTVRLTFLREGREYPCELDLEVPGALPDPG
ncbi:hypothetical protein [Streptomyces purpureus]|uniref:Uncharacterized protein n=1 Tax=Streptomyces purpureus TaxID=1951 RepID=A0A918HCN6_9ACTN|nr:hypothetical protein [Streptomyces purpureus]GGT53717.1 hypothetical protein GCM10014713_54500 [Streptomyces purpureus]